MVDFARVQNRIYYGYQKVAQHLGVTFSIYRTATGLNPIAPANQLPSQLVWIDQDFKADKSRKYGDMTWQFTPFNGLSLQNYDYMVGPTTTYYIGDIAPADRFTPPMCVECNAVITIYDIINTPVPGNNPYQEYQRGTVIISNAPVCILQYTRMEGINLKEPTSVKLPTYYVFVPDFDDVVIRTGQEIADDKGRRMMIINAEQTKKSLGLRLLAQEVAT